MSCRYAHWVPDTYKNEDKLNSVQKYGCTDFFKDIFEEINGFPALISAHQKKSVKKDVNSKIRKKIEESGQITKSS